MRANDPPLPMDPAILHEYMRRSIGDAVRYATFLDAFVLAGDASPGAELIRELLGEKRRWAIEHTFRALGILHPRHDLRSVHDAISRGDGNRRSAAREIVESLLPVEQRSALLAVVDDLTPADRRARLGDLAAGPFPTYEALLGALLADSSESLKCVVAHHIAERHLVALRHDLSRLRPIVGPPLLIYAFDQAIARLDV